MANHATSDDDAGADGRRREPERHETPAERSDRNWADLLQELRVTQTGVQLLTAFLLAIPFQPRFATLTDTQVWLYLAVVVLAVAATGLLVTPVSLHRALFRKKEKETLVLAANRLAQAGLALFATAVAGVVFLVFDVTRGSPEGVVAGSVTLVVLAVMWAAVPIWLRRRSRRGKSRARLR